MRTAEELRNELRGMDRRSYPAYKALAGTWQFEKYRLTIDHVQGDPFAAPSKVHIEVSGQKAGFPKEYYDTEDKRTAVQDFVLRLFAGEVQNYSFQAKGSGKSGLLSVSRCGQCEQARIKTCCSQSNPFCNHIEKTLLPSNVSQNKMASKKRNTAVPVYFPVRIRSIRMLRCEPPLPVV